MIKEGPLETCVAAHTGLTDVLLSDTDWDELPQRSSDMWWLLIPHSIKVRWPELDTETRAGVVLTAWHGLLIQR